MIALLQRCTEAQVRVDNEVVGSIGSGIVLFLGVEKNDTRTHCEKLARKVLNYRIFADDNDKMNLSILDTHKELLVISQFTLAADTNSGTRPSFSTAKEPQQAQELYHLFIELVRPQVQTQSGIFAADMQVSLTNDGPVTFSLRV